MKLKLGDIAKIQTGLFANNFADGDIVYLQAKHFNEEGLLKYALHPDLNSNEIEQRHLLKKGDVLFAAKGTRNFAAVYQNKKQACVASTSFFVIRLIEKNILPEYLAWYLNHPNTQQLLKNQAIGTSMVSISKVVLQNLEIHIPDLKTQKNILHVTELWKKEKQLKLQIETLREQQIQNQILNSINKL
ncbi:MAG TPA: restriction endonuclease subunit S [Bacteroidales bacterium]|jgi:restriction endonuclease S subunit|nr:restriction endonuclease subunit S [Paludibacteraceae bacterium]HPI31163.1 restriction endonuclease subunit S [Bacteroidales bacterium]HQN16702.1 restriction endonuclease subunit S [Bacteroidales bacterium]